MIDALTYRAMADILIGVIWRVVRVCLWMTMIDLCLTTGHSQSCRMCLRASLNRCASPWRAVRCILGSTGCRRRGWHEVRRLSIPVEEYVSDAFPGPIRPNDRLTTDGQKVGSYRSTHEFRGGTTRSHGGNCSKSAKNGTISPKKQW